MLFLAEKTSSSFTAAGTQAIMWISEIWHELNPALISRSFDHCGITSSNLADYSRHFARTNCNDLRFGAYGKI